MKKKNQTIPAIAGGGATRLRSSLKCYRNSEAKYQFESDESRDGIQDVQKNGNLVSTCQFDNNLLRKFAFTLAEVLITLGIIGVVAALTIPSIMAKTKTKEASARLKKFYSSMSQAILMSEIENGPSREWIDRGVKYDSDNKYDPIVNGEYANDFVMKYFAPYLKYNSIKYDIIKDEADENNITSKNPKLYFSDGSTLIIFFGSCMDMRYDVNGDRKPNEAGYDRFTFLLCPTELMKIHFEGNKNWGTYGPVRCPTRDIALDKCKNTPASCSVLLEFDNWEFKDDYPYKF